MMATDRKTAEQVIDDAKKIRNGQDPAKVAAAPPPAGAASAPGGGAGNTPPASPAPDNDTLAQLAVCLTDGIFAALFGEEGKMTGTIRKETVTAWGAVIAYYAPAIQQVGPLGALAGCYLGHAAVCLLTVPLCPTPASSPAPPADGDLAKPPS